MAKDLKIKINLSIDGKQHVIDAKASTKQLADALGVAQDKASALGSVFSKWQATAIGIQAVQGAISNLQGAIGNITGESKDFNAAMREANTMAGQDAAGFATMKKQVTDLAATIPVARDALARGLYQVVSNGVPQDNWISYLEASAKASVGGIAELGSVVNVTSTIIKNYGLEWSQAAAIQDKIQMTAKNGVTSFEQLAQALPSVTANAATLGVSVDELMASFATLTGVSGNTAEVATQLGAVFTSLVKPSSEATKMAEEMGLQFDAAAIQAAGGFQQFLETVTNTVRSYAAAHGMLEQEIFGKLFGSSRSLRAIIPITGELADKFKENCGVMRNSAGSVEGAFDQMSNTSAAAAQRLTNALAPVRDAFASAIGGMQPYLNFASSVGMTVMSFEAVRKAAVAFFMTLRNSAAVTALVAAGQKAYNFILTEYRAITIAAAMGTNMLAVAIRGLLIATGVGAAIVALGLAINALIGHEEDATEKTKQLTDAQNATAMAQQQEREEVSRLTGQMKMHISQLQAFKGSKAEEKRLVQEMNNTYGQTMGYFSSVSAWYKALTANSEAYTRQMIAEARARRLANQIAEVDAKIHDINYDEQGNRRKYSAQNKTTKEDIVDDFGNPIGQRDVVVKGSSDWDKAAQQTTQLAKERVALERQLNDTIKDKTVSYKVQGSPVAPTFPTGTTTTPKAGSTGGTTNTDNTPKLTLAATTYKQLAENVRYYEQQLETANFTDKESYKQLVLKKEAAEDAMESYRLMVEDMRGLAGFKEDATSVRDMRANVDVLQKQLEKTEPRSEAYTTITAEIENWQRRLSDIADGSMGDIERTIQSIDDRLRRENLTVEAEVELTAQREALQRQLDERARDVYFRVNILGKESSLKDIDNAIQYYTERQQEQSPDEVRKTQDTIQRLEKKREVYQLSIELAGQADEIREIEQLPEREHRMRIKAIGLDEITRRIDTIKARISDTENPATATQREELEQLMDTYRKWQRQSIDAMEQVGEAWGGIKSIGNGVENITGALQGQEDAWKTITGLVDGFLQIYQGIQAVAGIIQLLTTLSEAHTIAKGAEAAAVTAEGAAEATSAGEAATANVAAAAVETAAASTELGVMMQLMTAKYLAAHASIPFAGFAIGSGFAAAGAGLVQSMRAIAAFAEGGIAYGPTLGLFGEYPGARSNPEVVAPLDKLRDYVQPEQMSGDVRFIIDGDKLVGILNKRNRHTSRT